MINVFIGAKDAVRTSHRCSNCGLINSFSFQTDQNTCISCNYPIDDNDLIAMKKYRERSIERLDYKINNQDGDILNEL